MEPHPKIKTICMEPARFFSVDREFFLKVHRYQLTEALSPCFEDALVCLYVTGGKGKIVINGLEFLLQPGCECLLSSYHVFEILPDDSQPLELALLVVDFVIRSYLIFNMRTPEENNDSFYRCPVIQLSERSRREYEEILTRFEREDALGPESSTLVKVGLYGQLSEVRDAARRMTGARPFTPPLGWSLLLFITKFNSRDLTPEFVAQHFHLTVSAMNRELRRITTYNFHQLLSRSRINTACTLLPLARMSLGFIAGYIGFSSENSFYRAFRTWKGMTPQQYRDTVPKQVWGYARKSIEDEPWSVLNYICSNYRSPINIRTAAESLYLSERTINQILVRYTGVSFRDHLTQHRLQYARALLATTFMPVCDVAAESGFGAMNTFCRLFKAAFQQGPSEYRKQYGGENGG